MPALSLLSLSLTFTFSSLLACSLNLTFSHTSARSPRTISLGRRPAHPSLQWTIVSFSVPFITGSRDRAAKESGKDIKVLLLGTRESGKSTVLKQMKIMYQNGFTEDERMAYRPTIYQNTLDNARAIICAMRKIGLGWANPDNHANADRISKYKIPSSPSLTLSSEIVGAIHQMWNDPIIPKLMDRSSQIYLMDNAAYFFDDILRIGAPGFLPTQDDVIRTYQKTMNFTETRLTVDQLRICMVDLGGQRSERMKWISYFENVASVVFCASLNEYDQVLPEDETQNRLLESISLFEAIVNSRWFLNASIILFLNKADVFKSKLSKVSLERYFPDYSGGADQTKAVKYILWRFMLTNRARLPVYAHFGQATDTASCRFVLMVVKETILQNMLTNTNLLD